MPAARIYLNSHDIAQVTGVSLREAQYMLAMFEERGQVVKHGRKKTVYVGILSKYLAQQDGSDPNEVKREIQLSLKQVAQGA